MITFPDLDGQVILNDALRSRIKLPGPALPHGGMSFLPISASERNAVANEIEADIRLYLSTVSTIQVADERTADDLGMTYSSGDPAFDPPPSVYSEVNVKNGMSHEEFTKRKAAGEIMMSDYERAVIRVKQDPGICSSSHITAYTGSIHSDALVDAGIILKTPANTTLSPSASVYWYKGYVFQMNGYFDIGYLGRYRRKRMKNPPTYVFPAVMTASDVLVSARAEILPSASLVTNTVAKANRSAVDVLTAFAELPKSIESVIRGFKLVAGILKDAKKREFDLNKAYAFRKKQRSKKYLQRMSRLDSELSKKGLSYNRRYNLERHRKNIVVGHRDALKRSADELASELASVWLNYRYNIMPNVYLAQDIFEANLRFGRQFVTAAGTVRNDGSLPVGRHRISMSTKLRCVIKRKFSAKSANSGLTVISNDIFVTAWELVPLSFVYDWFINFGDLLAAQTYAVGWEAEKCSLASKFDLDATVVDPSQMDCTVQPQTVVSGFYYKRKIINPRDYCGLVWQPKLGLERQIDAAALAWPSVRSLLLKGKQR